MLPYLKFLEIAPFTLLLPLTSPSRLLYEIISTPESHVQFLCFFFASCNLGRGGWELMRGTHTWGGLCHHLVFCFPCAGLLPLALWCRGLLLPALWERLACKIATGKEGERETHARFGSYFQAMWEEEKPSPAVSRNWTQGLCLELPLNYNSQTTTSSHTPPVDTWKSHFRGQSTGNSSLEPWGWFPLTASYSHSSTLLSISLTGWTVLRLFTSLVPRPHLLKMRNRLVNQVEFLGLPHTFATV